MCKSCITDIWTVPAGHSNVGMCMVRGMEHAECSHAWSLLLGVNGWCMSDLMSYSQQMCDGI